MLERFWELIAQEVRYKDEHPTLRNLLLRLFTTDFVRHVTGDVPDALRHLMLPNGGGANVVVFMDAWRDSSTYGMTMRRRVRFKPSRPSRRPGRS